jgi:hypothetical protein
VKSNNPDFNAPSSVHGNNTVIDNSQDTSIRNMSNWWNIDPIITPKEDQVLFRNNNNNLQQHVRPKERESIHQRPTMKQNEPQPALRSSVKPEHANRRSVIQEYYDRNPSPIPNTTDRKNSDKFTPDQATKHPKNH